jgi:rhodanese-related sulfurtransferase
MAMSVTVEKINKDDLRDRLSDPEVAIIDVRHITQWSQSQVKIKGAVWQDRDEVDSWAGKYSPEQTLVLYCA